MDVVLSNEGFMGVLFKELYMRRMQGVSFCYLPPRLLADKLEMAITMEIFDGICSKVDQVVYSSSPIRKMEKQYHAGTGKCLKCFNHQKE